MDLKKQILFDLKQCHQSQGIQVKVHQLKPENNILKMDNVSDAYYTIVYHPPTSRYHLYYRSNSGIKPQSMQHGVTRLAFSDDGINFTKPKLFPSGNNVVLDEKCVSHNFTCCYDPVNQEFKGIGGLHTPHLEKGHRRCPKVKKINIKGQLGGVISIANPKVKHPCRLNGLYAYSSKDGIKWTCLNGCLPVISGFHPGNYDRFRGWSEYDGHISLFWDQNVGKFALYLRSNVGKTRRFIQMTYSTDMIHWEPMKLINVTPKYFMSGKKQNYYFANFFPYPETTSYLGLCPYIDDGAYRNESGLVLMSSFDGVNWIKMKNLIPTKKVSGRNTKHPVVGMASSPSGDEYYLYIQENYLNWDKSSPWELKRYSFEKDRLVSFHVGTEGTCVFQVGSSQISINYRCLDSSGYLKCQLLNNDFKVIKKLPAQRLTEEATSADIWDPAKYGVIKAKYVFYLKITMKNADLFSLSY